MTLVGGVVIDGLNIKKDLFYYKIPPFLVDKIEIGAKVSVPFGPGNIKASAFLFTLEENRPIEGLKEIQAVISPPLFDRQTRDLILFIAENFFIPLHIFVNKVIKGLSPEIYRRFVVCLSEEKLREFAKTYSGKKKEIAEFIIQRKAVPVSVLKKRFGKYYGAVVKSLEEEGLVERLSVSEKFTLPYIFLNIPYEKTENVLDLFENKKLRSSAAAILGRLLSAKSPLREDDLKKGITYGRRIIEFLVEKGVLRAERIGDSNTKANLKAAEFSLICGLSLIERTFKIIENIKKHSKGKTLIVFSELSVLNRVSKVYKKEFGEKVFVWNGKDKRKLIEAIYFKEKSIFLVTSFALFVKIPNLDCIVLEGASSRYFKKTDFTPFDVLITSVKKAKLENLKLIFSTPVPEESIFYLRDAGVLGKIDCYKEKHQIKIIDMRNEFKKGNYKMISSVLQSEIRNALKNSKNIALLLNRKSYSTFVMCRECGYVMRCPKCDVPLYYDKSENVLYCHICGYKEKPPNVCPRCGSVNIKYFSGGIQKLEEQLVRMFPDARIVKLISGEKSEFIVNSEEYEKTIFIGTEYMISHLDLSNISAFGFVSADIFLNRFSFNASVDTFSLISEVAIEMKEKPVYVQTYIPEHFVLNYAKRIEFEKFFKEELELRKELSYPPFSNLLIFKFSSVNKVEAEKSASLFKEKIIFALQGKIKAFGPSPSAVQKRGDYYFFEVTVKTHQIDPALRDIYLEFLNNSGEVKISVEPYISIKAGLD